MSVRPTDPQFPGFPDTHYTANLVFQLKRLLSVLTNRVNGLADGRLSSIDNAATAAPTTGTWAQGDFIRNSAPVEGSRRLDVQSSGRLDVDGYSSDFQRAWHR